MNPVPVFLERTLVHHLFFLFPLVLTYLLMEASGGAGCFGIVLALATGTTGWFCDKQTFAVVPQALENEDHNNLAHGASLVVNSAISFLVMVDTHRPNQSALIFLIVIGLKLIVPGIFTVSTYETFKTLVFPTLPSEETQGTGSAKAGSLQGAQQLWQQQDKQEKLNKERARLNAIQTAQALVLDFYTTHRSHLKTIITDAMILTKVQAAIQTTATLEQANAAANALLTELHQHLKTTQAKAAEAEERERQRRQKAADIDAQIAKLKERLANLPNSPLFADDEEAKAAESAGIERQIATLTQEKNRILNNP